MQGFFWFSLSTESSLLLARLVGVPVLDWFVSVPLLDELTTSILETSAASTDVSLPLSPGLLVQLLFSLSDRLQALFLNKAVMVSDWAVGVVFAAAGFLCSLLLVPALLLFNLRRLAEPSPLSLHTSIENEKLWFCL